LVGGLNSYRYAPNTLGWIDPFGLMATFGDLDNQGRPTGVFAHLKPSDLRPSGSSPPVLDPPGWLGGGHPNHQQRSHLLADTFGGSGSNARNLVALTDGSNHSDIGMSTYENMVRKELRNGKDVLYEVVPNYEGHSKTPSSVRMTAIDQNGDLLVDETIENGISQNRKACSLCP
jgi:uncharacterized protein RhaS with RHS repeats